MKKSLLAAALMSLFLAACGGDQPAEEVASDVASDVVASEVVASDVVASEEVVEVVASEEVVEVVASEEAPASEEAASK